MRCKTMGKVGEVALKIDIIKAFDQVNWNFFFGVLDKMGFNEKWVSWMKLCLRTMQFSIIVNGDHVGQISRERGLRQGDPLPPYLFIICTKKLSTLLK